jgi:hypothetical protein
MVAGVGDLLDADQAPRLGRPPPGDAADQRAALAQPPQRLARRSRHRCLLRPRDDRRQRAVDVGEDRAASQVGAQCLDQRARRGAGRTRFGRHGI